MCCIPPSAAAVVSGRLGWAELSVSRLILILAASPPSPAAQNHPNRLQRPPQRAPKTSTEGLQDHPKEPPEAFLRVTCASLVLPNPDGTLVFARHLRVTRLPKAFSKQAIRLFRVLVFLPACSTKSCPSFSQFSLAFLSFFLAFPSFSQFFKVFHIFYRIDSILGSPGNPIYVLCFLSFLLVFSLAFVSFSQFWGVFILVFRSFSNFFLVFLSFSYCFLSFSQFFLVFRSFSYLSQFFLVFLSFSQFFCW